MSSTDGVKDSYCDDCKQWVTWTMLCRHFNPRNPRETRKLHRQCLACASAEAE